MNALCGKGKLKSIKVTLKNQKYISEFSEIRDDPDICDEELENADICDGYELKGDRKNLLRCKLYSSR